MIYWTWRISWALKVQQEAMMHLRGQRSARSDACLPSPDATIGKAVQAAPKGTLQVPVGPILPKPVLSLCLPSLMYLTSGTLQRAPYTEPPRSSGTALI